MRDDQVEVDAASDVERTATRRPHRLVGRRATRRREAPGGEPPRPSARHRHAELDGRNDDPPAGGAARQPAWPPLT